MKEKIKNTLLNNPVALATINLDGSPNVIGVSSVKLIEDRIVITDNFMKKTKENVLKDNRVCLVVWNNELEGFKITGSVEYHSNGKWFNMVKKMKENKEFFTKGALVMKINKINELE